MTWKKALVVALLAPVISFGLYIGFLAGTYNSEAVSSGSAYGFHVGDSKLQVATSLEAFQREHPEAAVYVSHGPRAGDNFTVPASSSQLGRLRPHDQWHVLLAGPGNFNNSVRLTFEQGTLVRIYRHRQYFELP